MWPDKTKTELFGINFIFCILKERRGILSTQSEARGRRYLFQKWSQKEKININQRMQAPSVEGNLAKILFFEFAELSWESGSMDKSKLEAQISAPGFASLVQDRRKSLQICNCPPILY